MTEPKAQYEDVTDSILMSYGSARATDPSTHLIRYRRFWFLAFAEDGSWFDARRISPICRLGSPQIAVPLTEVIE